MSASEQTYSRIRLAVKADALVLRHNPKVMKRYYRITSSRMAIAVGVSLMFGQGVSAQTTFQRTFGGFFSDDAGGIATLPDTSIYLVGGTASFPVGTNGSSGFLMKTDGDGGFLWGRNYSGNGNNTTFRSVAASTTGNLLITGEVQQALAGLIISVDSSGNLLWSRSAQNTAEFSTASSTPAGDWLVAGSTLFGNADLIAFCLDAQGSTKWAHRFATSYDDVPLRIRPSPDGGAMVAGYTYTTGPYTDALLLKLDSLGGLVWSRVFSTAGAESFYDVLPLADGGYLTLGMQTDFPGTGWNVVMRLDSSLNVLWCHRYNNLSDGWAFEAMEMPGGFSVSMDGTAGLGTHALVLLNDSGAVVDANYYGLGGIGRVRGHRALPDGRFAIMSSIWSWGVGGYDVLLVLTHPDGTIDTCETALMLSSQPVQFATGTAGSSMAPYTLTPHPVTSDTFTPLITDQCALGVSVEEREPGSALSIYPNPAMDRCSGKGFEPGSSVAQFDMMGVERARFLVHTDGSLEIDLAGAPGSYVLLGRDASGRQVAVKVMKAAIR